jgi:hypothetical protein
MRTRLGCVGLLALASLSCGPRPVEPYPERLSCPRALAQNDGEPKPKAGCDLYDIDLADGVADLEVCTSPGPPRTTEIVILKDDRRFSVDYEGRVASSWHRPANPSPAGLEVAPPELSRMIPSLQEKVDASCLARPQVSAYLGELRDRSRSRWLPPDADAGVDRDVVVVLSLSASGEITGACFEAHELDSKIDAFGASAVRALQKAAPFGSMTTELEPEYETKTKTKTKAATTTQITTETKTSVDKQTDCLAGRQVIANFSAH